MHIVRLPASRGWHWIVQAARLLRRRPMVWLTLHVMVLLVGAALTAIPVLGPMMFALVTPVLMAGLMFGCRDLEAGRELELKHLLRGFQHEPARLITIGGVYLVGQIVIAGLLYLVGGEELQSALKAAMSPDADPAAPAVMNDRLSLSVLISLCFFVPLAMAVWFAPVLVALQNLQPLEAMKLSARACLSNMAPMVVYGFGLVATMMVLLLLLRLVLGVLLPGVPLLKNLAAMAVLVLWVALTMISVYTSYREIFDSDPAATA